MIDIEAYEHKAAVMALLKRQIGEIAQRERFGRGMLHQINSLFMSTRNVLRRQGVYFPPMAALILPSVRHFDLVRADLDRAAIKTVIINLFRLYPDLAVAEAVSAVQMAFPDYKPE